MSDKALITANQRGKEDAKSVMSMGRALPYLGMVGRFHADDPHFLRFFVSVWVTILCQSTT